MLGTGEVPQILDAIGSFAACGSRLATRRYRLPRGSSSQILSPHAWTPISSPGLDQQTPSSEPREASRERPVPDYLYDADTPRYLTTPKHFAYVKVAEGCDYTCAFCIIPTLRGSYRSRSADSIVREARALAERGVRELLLISQDTTFFGIDRGERGALGRLLRELNAIDGLVWIRLLYLYPTTITDDVLAAMAECDKVCRYIDLPLQHASAEVLKRMRRPGNRRTYDALLARIRARVPDVTLRTTLIVGFPGETAEDFAELESFVADTGFDHLGVFTYSHEEGTRASSPPRARRTSAMRDGRSSTCAVRSRRRSASPSSTTTTPTPPLCTPTTSTSAPTPDGDRRWRRSSAPGSAGRSSTPGACCAGAAGMAGELGHIPIPIRDLLEDDQPITRCNCGLTGDVESVASLTGIELNLLPYWLTRYPDHELASVEPVVGARRRARPRRGW